MEIENRLIDIFSVVMGIPVEQISRTCSPETVSSWDSFRQMNLVSALEEEFETNFSFEETTMITDYGSLIDLILRKVA